MAKERKRLRRGLLERLGALLMAGIFVDGGWHAFRDPGGRAGKAEKLGLPQPETMVRINGLAMMAGGLALATGFKPKLTAVGLIGSMIPTTLAGHRFWEQEPAQGRQMQLTQFLKNVGLIGGLLILLSKRRSVRVAAPEGQ